MTELPPASRVFLFLQGPHGPFFDRLAQKLRLSGCKCLRVAFNAGDEAFWSDKETLVPFQQSHDDWQATCRDLIDEKKVTDLVLYGDTRPVHAEAIGVARAMGLRVHVFEEGYLRPYWVTYERNGANGNSRLMRMPVRDMQQALENSDLEAPLPPGHWGDMRHHIFYGALYHWHVMFRKHRYPAFRPHRSLPVSREFQLYVTRLLLMPFLWANRVLATLRVRFGGFPYHVALLQLEHDSAFQMHSPFTSQAEFLEKVFDGFAQGAPKDHHLVIKAHPLENGQSPQRSDIRRLANARQLRGRVHFIGGGKLAAILDDARTAVTVNSTAGQQVLWRDIPLKVFGDAVYAKPGLVSDQCLPEFFANPTRPDSKAYKDYRRYLLETSQVPGGYYSARGRSQLLRRITEMMLTPHDPYDAIEAGTAAPRQQSRAVG